MSTEKEKWAKLLNGPISKPELTAKEMLEIALKKYKKKKQVCARNPTFMNTSERTPSAR